MHALLFQLFTSTIGHMLLKLRLHLQPACPFYFSNPFHMQSPSEPHSCPLRENTTPCWLILIPTNCWYLDYHHAPSPVDFIKICLHQRRS